jgi:hypothetical protein
MLGGASFVSPLGMETNFLELKSGFAGTTVLRVDGVAALQQLGILKTGNGPREIHLPGPIFGGEEDSSCPNQIARIVP